MFMKLLKLNLSTRIFLSMIALVLVASVLIAAVTIYQYREEARDYHIERLERKEENIKQHISNVLKATSFEIKPENLPFIFKEKIYEISKIHSLPLNIYDLGGELLISSVVSSSQEDKVVTCLLTSTLNNLYEAIDKRYVDKGIQGGESYQSSYSYITDAKFKPLAILNLPYLEEDKFVSKELAEFLGRLSYAYVFMLIIAVALSYFLSKYITKSLNAISQKIIETRLDKRNKKILIDDSSQEISTLVNAYNSMIDELENSAVQLAASEREAAWREMAKQVAHEIKNPLTPMRLTIQSFLRKFDPKDERIHERIEEYSNTLIQQIDTMSAIASAFSTYADMPAQKNETLNVVKVTKLALEIFNENYISFSSEEESIMAMFDRTQLIRVITNLIKNSIQAIPKEIKDPRIDVRVFIENKQVVITVNDNGIGISPENKPMVFELKFTTKTRGMGLGLPMVKNIVETYDGSITFASEKGEGTTFKVSFPRLIQ